MASPFALRLTCALPSPYSTGRNPATGVSLQSMSRRSPQKVQYVACELIIVFFVEPHVYLGMVTDGSALCLADLDVILASGDLLWLDEF